jgi:hypothetical protein
MPPIPILSSEFNHLTPGSLDLPGNAGLTISIQYILYF